MPIALIQTFNTVNSNTILVNVEVTLLGWKVPSGLARNRIAKFPAGPGLGPQSKVSGAVPKARR